MKIFRPENYNKIILPIISIAFLFFISFSFSSCARRLTFGVSPVVPAAEGSVKIKKNKNKNYILTVKTTNLAEPKRLSPPREVYVVWMESERTAPKNIGMIKSSTGFLSSTLKGEMTASSTVRPTAVFVTAEDDGNIQYPGSQVVLRTR